MIDIRIVHFLPYGTARTACGIHLSSAIRTDYRMDKVTCPRCLAVNAAVIS